ncbi:MAG TPA: D-amino-acid transaminase [Dongiaceae bacterium]|jgi:D-alanine transaminase|nr:D-amino-acid transaminase [Dongiaceae bacterium]
MARIAYVNGRYVPHASACVGIEDRGYQFGDGVYEVVMIEGGRPIDAAPHFDRLDRSLAEIRLPWPVRRQVLMMIIHELIRRNRIGRGICYIQVTRGVAVRDHKFPLDAEPSLVLTVKRIGRLPAEAYASGVRVITLPDTRWGRCDIKSINLLPNILGKQQAHEAGAYEAWLVDRHGHVTEGTSTNAWIVTRKGEIKTHMLDHAILPGITRQIACALAEQAQMSLHFTSFSIPEALDAAEAFLSSASATILPVIAIDGQPIGTGAPGPFTLRLRALFRDHILAQGHA